jgi:hypothetical protein
MFGLVNQYELTKGKIKWKVIHFILCATSETHLETQNQFIIKMQLKEGKILQLITFFPGLTSLKATSAAVLAAAITSAARPVTGPS